MNVYAYFEPQLKRFETTDAQTFKAWNRRAVPAQPGVYVIYRGRCPLYVGETSNLRRRVFDQHGNGRSSAFHTKLVEVLHVFKPGSESSATELIKNHMTFRFLTLGEGHQGYVDRRRWEAFLQAWYQPPLNFFTFKLVSPAVESVATEMLEGQSSDLPTLVKDFLNLKRIYFAPVEGECEKAA